MKTLFWLTLLVIILASIMKINAQSDSGQKPTDSILKFIGLKSVKAPEQPRSLEYVPRRLEEKPPSPAADTSASAEPTLTPQPTQPQKQTGTPPLPPLPPVLGISTPIPPSPPPSPALPPVQEDSILRDIANFLLKIADWF